MGADPLGFSHPARIPQPHSGGDVVTTPLLVEGLEVRRIPRARSRELDSPHGERKVGVATA